MNDCPNGCGDKSAYWCGVCLAGVSERRAVERPVAAERARVRLENRRRRQAAKGRAPAEPYRCKPPGRRFGT